MIEQIEQLYHRLENKTEFMKEVAIDLRKKPNTLKNHWFSGFFSIPDEYQKRVLEMLKEKLSKQSIQA